ncbi:hypothetical protein T01_12135 [Trichinella spiralis]|uniref:Uncharacterized protein n=1 Tax=Trichinella spiralis TaxID=6334 RepID=A0A0V1B1B7_TRISP|nr:hypothetical protein T01_12135 [Trichinella spiralis]
MPIDHDCRYQLATVFSLARALHKHHKLDCNEHEIFSIPYTEYNLFPCRKFFPRLQQLHLLAKSVKIFQMAHMDCSRVTKLCVEILPSLHI